MHKGTPKINGKGKFHKWSLLRFIHWPFISIWSKQESESVINLKRWRTTRRPNFSENTAKGIGKYVFLAANGKFCDKGDFISSPNFVFHTFFRCHTYFQLSFLLERSYPQPFLPLDLPALINGWRVENGGTMRGIWKVGGEKRNFPK